MQNHATWVLGIDLLVFNGTSTQKDQFLPTAGEGNWLRQSRMTEEGSRVEFVQGLEELREALYLIGKIVHIESCDMYQRAAHGRNVASWKE